jgi:hypothetical protein
VGTFWIPLALNAGERRAKILSGKPEGIKLRSVFDIR